jgi:hypothetical protein
VLVVLENLRFGAQSSALSGFRNHVKTPVLSLFFVTRLRAWLGGSGADCRLAFIPLRTKLEFMERLAFLEKRTRLLFAQGALLRA